MPIVAAIFALSAAIGLSLYAALAAPGLAAHLGLITLPDPIVGLAAPAVWGSLLALLAVELVLSRYRFTDLVWTAFHTLSRPLAAALLASVGLGSATHLAQWGGALLALLTALVVHLCVMGSRVIARTHAPFLPPGALAAIQALLAAGIATLAFLNATGAALIAWLLLVAVLPLAPKLIALALSAIRASVAMLWQPGRSRPTWATGADSLPTSLRLAVERHLARRPLGAVRSTRLTLARHGSRWPFNRGWLVVAPEAPPLFAHRQFLHPQVVELSPGAGHAGGELLIQTLEVEANTPYTLCIGPEAPPGPVVLAAIVAREGEGDPESSGGAAGQEHM